MNEFAQKVTELLKICRNKGIKIATAESCTGGMLSSAITNISGSSDVFERGFVTYSNESKTDLLGVHFDLMDGNGAVSKKVAIAMAEGALDNSGANLAISITGLAGPGGESAEKPVGLVYMASKMTHGDIISRKFNFKGSRDKIRKASVDSALDMLLVQVSS